MTPFQIRVSNTIRLPREAALSPGGFLLKKKLTYKNPGYAIALSLGFSTHNIPAEVHTFSLFEDGGMEIYRGEAMKVKEAFPNAAWTSDFPSHPVAGLRFESADFALDEHQLKAVEAMKKTPQGLILAVTSAGKTTIVLKTAVEIGQKTLILVHRKILLDQFLDAIKTHLRKEDGSRVVPGVIGNGKCTVGDEITVAIEKSFSKHPELFKEFGSVFVDEVHLAPASIFSGIINNLPARHRYGLTGTLKRKDGKQFLVNAMFGNVLAEINKEELLDLDRISPVHLEIFSTSVGLSDDPTITEAANPWQAYEKDLANNMVREEEILEYAENILSDPYRKLIILTRFVEQAKRIRDKLAERTGFAVGLVIGGRNDQKEQCDFLEAGMIRALVATVSTVSTGVNIPSLTDIILTAPVFSNHALLGQIRGRLMRKSKGKTHGTLHFVWDGNVYESYRLSSLKYIFKK